jgi:hypothetical protein
MGAELNVAEPCRLREVSGLDNTLDQDCRQGPVDVSTDVHPPVEPGLLIDQEAT